MSLNDTIRTALLLVAVCVGGVSPTRAAEVLWLRNGDRVTGTVLSGAGGQLVVSNAWNAALAIPLDQMEKREPVVVAAPVAPPIVAVVLPAGTNAPLPVAQTPPPPKEKKSTWHGDAQAGLDVRRGAKDSQLYHGRLKITQVYEKWRNILDYTAAYGKTDKTMSANRMDGALKTDFDLAHRMFAYNMLGTGYDRVRKLDLRYEIGPGMGYHLLTRTNLLLALEGGGSYEARDYSDGTFETSFSLRVAEDVTWKINDRLLAEEKLEFFPQFDNLADYRIRFESTLKFLLRQNLTLNLTLLDQYDASPPLGVPANDMQIRSAIGVKF
jgi:putative salt-induced outer membrane protein YdiY